jgi:hypothetical protein
VIACHPELAPKLLKTNLLVTHTDSAVLDIQMPCPLLDGTTAPTAEQGHDDAGTLEHPHRQAIAHIEAFHDPALLVVVEAAIGEHPVHIAHHQADLT